MGLHDSSGGRLPGIESPPLVRLMHLCPDHIAQLEKMLATAHLKEQRVATIDLSAIHAIREYHPEDLTITVEAGMRLSSLKAELAQHGQWLPLDPPPVEDWTLGRLIDMNPSGPRRMGQGVLRDYVVGLEFVRANGQRIRTGGRVVKNVAGFDLSKCLIGAQGRLGVVTALSLKLMPLPAFERQMTLQLSSLEEAETVAKIMRSNKDHHHANLWELWREASAPESLQMVIGFSGHREAVLRHAQVIASRNTRWSLHEDWQADSGATPPTCHHETLFWQGRTWLETPRESVLPTRLSTVLEAMPPEESFVARMGQGVFYHGGEAKKKPSLPSANLIDRAQKLFDPAGVFMDRVE